MKLYAIKVNKPPKGAEGGYANIDTDDYVELWGATFFKGAKEAEDHVIKDKTEECVVEIEVSVKEGKQVTKVKKVPEEPKKPKADKKPKPKGGKKGGGKKK